ncbi:MAG: hypothetical protein ACOYXB_11650 [Bacteroidota bacterium]
MKRILPLVLLLAPALLHAQLRQSDYFAAGSSALTDGFSVKLVNVSSYTIGKLNLTAGLQFTLDGSDQQAFSGWSAGAGYRFLDERFPLDLQLFFMQNPYSPLTRENNSCLTLSHRWDHFELLLGNNTRSWKLAAGEVDPDGLPDGTDYRVTEYRNLIYRFTAYLFAPSSPWNLSLTLTDMDDFLIQQETNPMISAAFRSEVKPGLTLFTEAWYQGAGMLNLHADYFGFYLKGGVQWQL